MQRESEPSGPFAAGGCSARVAALVAGILLAGCAQTPPPDEGPAEDGPESAGIAPTLATVLAPALERLRREVSRERLQKTSQELCARPHHAGSVQDRKTADYVHQQFLLAGLESTIEEYQVLIPYPDEVTVELLRPVAYRASLKEEPLQQDYDTHTRAALPPHVAYAADGDVMGPLVYVNRGTARDLERLEELKVNLAGRIAIVRTGGPTPASVARRLENARVIGLILYQDPADGGYMRGDVYPDGPWAPESAAPRLSALDRGRHPGDPLSPGRAVRSTPRRPGEADLGNLPAIPAAALSGKDARPLLESLRGPGVPSGWQGGLPFAYHVGGTAEVTARVRTTSDWRPRRIWNVVGKLRGSLFPDQWVLAGSPRDAWVHGASASVSGTAALVETARVLGVLAEEGRRPARTVVLCSFDGSAYGNLGSIEFTEHHAAELRERAALYLDFGTAVAGGEVEVRAGPELARLLESIIDAAREEARLETDPYTGSGEQIGFAQGWGVPTVSVMARGPDGVRDTLYDTYGWMKRYGDPEWMAHARVTALGASILFQVASSTVSPYDFAALASWIEARTDEIAARQPTLDLTALRTALALLGEAGASLDAARTRLAAADPDPLRLRLLNRTIAGSFRLLAPSQGLPGRPFFHHLLYAPDPDTPATPITLPHLRDALTRGNTAAAAEVTRLARILTELADNLTAIATRLDEAATTAASR